jgi:hypothetical protein
MRQRGSPEILRDENARRDANRNHQPDYSKRAAIFLRAILSRYEFNFDLAPERSRGAV